MILIRYTLHHIKRRFFNTAWPYDCGRTVAPLFTARFRLMLQRFPSWPLLEPATSILNLSEEICWRTFHKADTHLKPASLPGPQASAIKSICLSKRAVKSPVPASFVTLKILIQTTILLICPWSYKSVTADEKSAPPGSYMTKSHTKVAVPAG